MPIEVWEHIESRQISRGSDPAARLHYIARGSTDEGDTGDAVLATAPTLYDIYNSGVLFIARKSVEINPLGQDIWEAFVYYGTTPLTGDALYEFEIGGGADHITQSIRTVNRYAPAGQTAPDFKGAINVAADGTIGGVDLSPSGDDFTEVHYFDNGDVTEAYKNTLRSLRRTKNNAPFRGRAAGEVVFFGVTGAPRAQGDWELRFKFSVSPNRTGIAIPEVSPVITGIDKAGWDYLWVYYEEASDASARRLVKRPAAAYVEQVFYEGNFALLGI